jgi:glycosyltransferase involved in cell wall biosynthesis
LNVSGNSEPYRIVHLTTLGTKCGIGEYTKKIVDTYNGKGFKNFVISCDSAKEAASPYANADRFHVGWYLDNEHWVGSHIKPDLIDKVVEWGAQGILIQYHPSFYSPATLLEFVRDCLAKGLPTAIVVHNYSDCSPAEFYKLNNLGVTIFSHQEEEGIEAEKQGIELDFLPLGVDVQQPLINRDISNRNMQLQPPVIVTNGFLRKHKGVRTLIKSMLRILEVFPGAKLRVQCAIYSILDSEEEFTLCKKDVDALGLKDSVVFDTQFLEKSELLNELSKADLAVLPYEINNEGSSASASDALAVGLPLIVSEANIFNPIRCTCLTVKPDEESLAKAIIQVLSCKEQYKILSNASVNYAKRNAWEHVGGYYLAALFNE